MQIRKSMYIMIASVVLIASISLISYASDVSVINTSLNRPETFQRVVDGKYHTQFNVCCYRFDGVLLSPAGINYLLQSFEIVSDNAIRVWFKGARICCSDVFDSCKQSCYDLSTGSLVTSYNNSYFVSTGIGGSDYQYVVSSQPLPQVQNREVDQYVLDVPSWLTESYTRSNEFVNWSVSAPDQTSYHSKLSEPQWDLYNRYFILDDILYWVSFDINGFYVQNEAVDYLVNNYNYQVIVPVEGGYDAGYSSEVVQYQGYSPVGLSYKSTFGDLPFSLALFPSSDEWQVKIQSADFLVDNSYSTIIDLGFYISSFDLYDGSYIGSSYYDKHFENLNEWHTVLAIESSASSVRCYGIEFRNINNLPINLSSVTWEYDIAWVKWRNATQIYLQQIYDLLNSSPSDSVEEPTTYPNYGDQIASEEPSFAGHVSADDVAGNLDDAMNGDFNFGNAASAVREWVDWFSVPKIIALCVFALACGSVILILGKKKSD